MFTSTGLLNALAIGLTNAAVAQALAVYQESTTNPLENFNADPNTVTVSGYSAGGQFSCHLMTVMSETIKGAGCSKGGAFTIGKDTDMSKDQIKNAAIKEINELALADHIDPVVNLEDNAVMIISGSNDPVVPAKNQEAVKLIFENYSMQSLKLVSDDLGHN